MPNHPSDPICEIRGMQFPPYFQELWISGKWRQPEDQLIRTLIPWLQGPIEFIENMRWLRLENRGRLADTEFSRKLFQEYHGKSAVNHPDLPWLDVDASLMIAVNKIPGDDLGIAIDFRTSLDDPRVVASLWCTEPHRVEWRLVSKTFSGFVESLQIDTAGG